VYVARIPRQPLTDVQGVIVATQAIQDGLLGTDLVLSNVIWFAILGDGSAHRRTSNHFREFFAGGLGAEVETRTLETG
jgi:hypothetical protein